MPIILNARDNALQIAAYRSKDTLVTVTSTAGAFKTPKNGGITTPGSITLTAIPNNVYTSSVIYTWHYALSATPTVWVLIGTGISTTILNTTILSIIGDSTQISYRCTATETLLDTSFGFFTVNYSKDVSDPIVIDMSRLNASIACDSAGVPIGYTNTDTAIKVSRGGVFLNYNTGQTGLAAANTFTVTVESNANLTLGTETRSGVLYSLAGITAMSTTLGIDMAKIVFTIIVYDAAGLATPTLTKEIVYTKISNGFVGRDAVVNYIDLSAAVIFKSTSSALIAGTHTNITATGKTVTASVTATGGYLTITANGATEATLATANTITTNIDNAAGKTSYTVNMYSKQDKTATGGILLDTEVIPVVFNGDSAVTLSLDNDSHNIPTNPLGAVGIYTGSGTKITAYEGTKLLLYDAVGTANGTWRIDMTPGNTTASNITMGTPIVDSGDFATVPDHTNMTADNASIKYVIIGKTYGGNAFTVSKIQSFAKAVKGETGAAGTKSITVNAYRWSKTGIGAISKSFTYTWDATVASYPTATDTTWAGSAGAAPGSGYTLYQISLTISDLSTALTTLVDWSNAVSNQLGYRLDGSIGLTGNSARVAYRVLLTSSGVPGKPGDSTGDTMPNSDWSGTATSTLSEGYSMYQVDGILSGVGTDTIKVVWGNPYLSNLKVGSLSALTANLGTVNVSTVGSLSNTRTYGEASAGFFLGYHSTAYKFEVTDGISTGNFLRWDGVNLSLSGAVYATSGTIGGNVIDSTGISSPGYSNVNGVINGWKLTSAGDLFAKTGTFGGSLRGADIAGATGNFSGGLSGADVTGTTGTFTGKLVAGAVDFKSSVGVTVSYNTPGDYPIVVPAGCTKMRVTLKGGGGGGAGGSTRGTGESSMAGRGGAGSGGSQGATTTILWDVWPGYSKTLRVGGGGTGGGAWDAYSYQADPNTATAGGETYLDGVLSAPGGARGNTGYQGQPIMAADSSEFGTGLVSSGNFTGGKGTGTGGGLGGTSTNARPSIGTQGGGGGGGYGSRARYGTDPNMPNNGASGGSGYAIIEFFDPNGVVLKGTLDTLKAEIRARSGWAIS
jgi:hypothetical protein